MAISDMVDAAIAVDMDRAEISAAAWSVDAYVGLGSQYVYRGVALRDAGPVVSAELSLAHSSGWFIDTWAGRVDAAAYYGQLPARQWLLDVNVGYGAELSTSWQWSLSRAWIAGVDTHLPESQNYQEWRANLFYRHDVALQLAYAENYHQLHWAAWNAEIQGQHPLTDAISGEWGVGHSHYNSATELTYNYAWLGLQTDWLDTHWRLRWIHSDDDARYVLADGRAGSRVELALNWHWTVWR